MSLTRALRTLTGEEQDYVRARRTRYGALEAPSPRHLVPGVLGSAIAAGAVYALTCGRECWLAAFVFVVGTTVMVVRHFQKRSQAVNEERSRWDPLPGTRWVIAEWHLGPSSVVEVSDAETGAYDWLLFRVSDDLAFVIPLLDLNFEAVGPASSLESIAREHLVLRKLWPDGPMLPALPSGAAIPIHSSSIEQRTWSPPDDHDLGSWTIALDKLPDWLRDDLV